MIFSHRIDEDVSLAFLLPTDLDEVWRLIEANREALTYWFPGKPHWASREGLGEEYVKWIKRLASEPGYTLAIRTPDGTAGLIWHSRVDERHGWCELGYWLDAAAQGRGLVTRAVRAMTEFSMLDLGMKRVEVCASPKNTASCAVPERLGFTREAVLRSRWVMDDGRHDQVMYALLRDEFDEQLEVPADRKPVSFEVDLGDGLAIRLGEPRHAEELFDLIDRQRDHLAPWFGWVSETKELQDTRNVRAEFVHALAENRTVGGLITLDGAIVGSVSLRIQQHCCGDIGFWLADHAQGKGVMTRCVNAMLQHSFVVYGHRRVQMHADVDNVRSIAVAERLGMTREGVVREGVRDEHKVRDMALYSILRDEWQAKR